MDFSNAIHTFQRENVGHEKHVPDATYKTVEAEDKLPAIMRRVIRVENFLPLRIALDSAIRIAPFDIDRAFKTRRGRRFSARCYAANWKFNF